jgi:sporadic carbohydrate cluster protein (TIGR04323 family)|tara:strand:+ start:89 stop:505 length:417 start_codon:yes stop_codon:yes gene_type:complete
MKFKKVKGYIFSREINGTIIPQKVQNLVIREYCKNKNYIYQLSSVEHKMKNTFHVLDEVLNSLSNVNGIVMYSIFQLPYDEKKRISVLGKLFKKSKFVSFAMENIVIKNKKDLKKLNSLIKLNFLLKHCAKNISCLSN